MTQQLEISLNAPLEPKKTKSLENTQLKKQKRKPVLVRWLDAHQVGYWQEGNEELEAEPTEVHTLGWLLKTGQKAIYVAQSIAHDNHANAIVIPKNMVVEIVHLKDI